MYNRGQQIFSVKGCIVNILFLPATQPGQLCESRRRHYVNERAWPCANKTLFTKPGAQPTALV